ncbi:predicted protein [Streptomyces sp. AA4]|nr:predicted protein [Streptomyces sp. AA4]
MMRGVLRWRRLQTLARRGTLRHRGIRRNSKLLRSTIIGMLRWQRRLNGKLLESTVNSLLRWQLPQYVWCAVTRMTLKWLLFWWRWL